MTIFATVEVMGARLLAFHEVMPRDERGEYASQEYVDSLLLRPPLFVVPPIAGLATVVCRAVDVLGAPEKAGSWLDTQIQALDGQTPREAAETDPQKVLAVLTRIEQGGHE